MMTERKRYILKELERVKGETTKSARQRRSKSMAELARLDNPARGLEWHGTSKQVDTSAKPMLRLSIKWTMIGAVT